MPYHPKSPSSKCRRWRKRGILPWTNLSVLYIYEWWCYDPKGSELQRSISQKQWVIYSQKLWSNTSRKKKKVVKLNICSLISQATSCKPWRHWLKFAGFKSQYPELRAWQISPHFWGFWVMLCQAICYNCVFRLIAEVVKSSSESCGLLGHKLM